MNKIKKFIIKRIEPPIPKSAKELDFEKIRKAAEEVRKAVEKEEKLYGKMEFAS